MEHSHNGVLLGYKKYKNFSICCYVDGSGEDFALRDVKESTDSDFSHIWAIKKHIK